MNEPHGEPHGIGERAADAAITAFAEDIEAHGGKVNACIILGLVTGLPPDEPNGVIAGGNLEPEQIYEVLLNHIEVLGDAIGRPTRILDGGLN